MDSNARKVTVTSNSRSLVSIVKRDLNLNRQWPRKGSEAKIPFDVLEEALYDPGVEYMFKTGILYIKDMQDKIDLGLEPPDATTPQNIILMSDEEKKEYMGLRHSPEELREKLKQMSFETKKDFCDYVIQNELLDAGKATVIKEVCGIDILKAIQNKRANES